MADADIASRAAEPKRFTVDGQTAEQHSLAEQIEADRHVNTQAFRRKTARIRFSNLCTVLRPPGGA